MATKKKPEYRIVEKSRPDPDGPHGENPERIAKGDVR